MACTGYAITIDGVTHSQADWCRIYHTHPNTVRTRMDKGMTFEEALKFKPHGRQMLEPPMKVGRKAKPIDYGYKAKRTTRCKHCQYSEYADSQWVCMYCVIMKQRRGCEAGDRCIRFEPKKSNRMTEAQKGFKKGLFGGVHV